MPGHDLLNAIEELGQEPDFPADSHFPVDPEVDTDVVEDLEVT